MEHPGNGGESFLFIAGTLLIIREVVVMGEEPGEGNEPEPPKTLAE